MEWKEVRLGDVCEIKHGFAYKGKYFSDTPTCDILVTPGNFTFSGGFKLDKPKFYNGPVEKDYILSKGDLIVTMTDLSKNIDTLGYSALVPEVKGLTFHHNQRIGLVENIANNVDKYFLYWIMRTPAYQSFIATHSSGTTVHHTSPKGIGNYVFKLPPLDDQRRIASILSSLDRKIELNNKINADLEEMAQAIFKNWFVDFEPFKDGKFVDSELGMIPEGWKVGSPYEYVKVVYGAPYKSAKFNDNGEGLPLIRIRDLKDCNPQFYTPEILPQTEYVNMGDIIAGMDAEFVPHIWKGNTGLLNQRVCKLMPQQTSISNLFVLYLMKPELEFVQSYKTGTTVSHLGKADIDKFVVVLPPLKVVEECSKILDSILQRIKNISAESRNLSTLRDTLLPRLMSGELEVPE